MPWGKGEGLSAPGEIGFHPGIARRPVIFKGHGHVFDGLLEATTPDAVLHLVVKIGLGIPSQFAVDAVDPADTVRGKGNKLRHLAVGGAGKVVIKEKLIVSSDEEIAPDAITGGLLKSGSAGSGPFIAGVATPQDEAHRFLSFNVGLRG